MNYIITAKFIFAIKVGLSLVKHVLQNDAKNTIDTCKLLFVLCSIRLHKVLLCFYFVRKSNKNMPEEEIYSMS